MRFHGPYRSANMRFSYYASHGALSRPAKKLTSEALASLQTFVLVWTLKHKSLGLRQASKTCDWVTKS